MPSHNCGTQKKVSEPRNYARASSEGIRGPHLVGLGETGSGGEHYCQDKSPGRTVLSH